MKLKPTHTTVFICLFITIMILSACSQRYWFRKKSGSNNTDDSTIVEKDYQIVW